MQNLLNECQRIGHPGFVITDRIALQDINVNGVKIPKGHKITIPLGANFQREDFFKKPREFNLERWEEKNMKSL